MKCPPIPMPAPGIGTAEEAADHPEDAGQAHEDEGLGSQIIYYTILHYTMI